MMSSPASNNYTARSVGSPSTPDHRVFVSFNGHIVSALHDVPLLSNSNDLVAKNTDTELTLNMVVEAPRWTNAQMKIAPDEAFAPIRQAMRKRRVAYVRNCFPHRGYIWNYGALPQTWASGGPLHVCELGERIAQVGDVRQVRVLGVLAPRDEGILRWTLLVVDITDPLAARLHNIDHLERECPGMITATKEWFRRLYKLPEGKEQNTIELGGEVKGRDYAREIVRTAHEAWRNVVTASTSRAVVDLSNVTIRNSPGLVKRGDEDLDSRLRETRQGSSPSIAPPLSASKWWYIAREVE
ncbi:inorganic diphosphatase [Mycena alexandri]|uniref:inorganic diphosphatase n=1 Tax=Mycena alexandri TaxID=1745969 RepID=A0AAD6WMD1_9AGAR|nr:inorganic diphosphatase [Mycena alexandri]